jgi:hypothetical protein
MAAFSHASELALVSSSPERVKRKCVPNKNAIEFGGAATAGWGLPVRIQFNKMRAASEVWSRKAVRQKGSRE